VSDTSRCERAIFFTGTHQRRRMASNRKLGEVLGRMPATYRVTAGKWDKLEAL
jgi:hypothetical protein